MITFYSSTDLISFGNYLLSEERRETFKQHPGFTNDELLEERLSRVSHADFENWSIITNNGDIKKD